MPERAQWYIREKRRISVVGRRRLNDIRRSTITGSPVGLRTKQSIQPRSPEDRPIERRSKVTVILARYHSNYCLYSTSEVTAKITHDRPFDRVQTSFDPARRRGIRFCVDCGVAAGQPYNDKIVSFSECQTQRWKTDSLYL